MATTASALAALKTHLAKPVYSEQLSSLDSVRMFAVTCYPSSEVKIVRISDDPEAEDSRWVTVCTTKLSQVEGGSGLVNAARVVFDSKGDYSLEVLLKSIRAGSWKASEDPHTEISGILDMLLASLMPRLIAWGKLSLVHTVCACAKIYGKESVNVSVNDLSHVVRSSTEQHACIVSGRTRN